MPAVTLLQATTLGRQSLAAGCIVQVDEAQALAWVEMGIARLEAKTATQPQQAQDDAQNMPLPLAPAALAATKNVANNEGEAAEKAPQKAKTATQRKRGG